MEEVKGYLDRCGCFHLNKSDCILADFVFDYNKRAQCDQMDSVDGAELANWLVNNPKFVREFLDKFGEAKYPKKGLNND